MPLSLNEIRDRAQTFARAWREVGSERAEAQTFWNEFLDVFGVNRRRVAAFERPVEGAGRIDMLWKGRLLVEHKSRGQNLDRAAGQARDYFAGLRDADLPRYVIVSDFARIRLYDLEGDDPSKPEEFPLEELPNRIGLFGFISGYETRSFGTLRAVDVQAARHLGELHDALERAGYRDHPLQVWMVRLLFCLFADRTGIFPAGLFREYLDKRTADDGTDLGPRLTKLSEVLNTRPELRSSALDEQLQELPFVNGRLFAETLPIPDFNAMMRGLLLDATRLDWAGISPAIFGSLFQSIKDKKARRYLGEFYTTESNILKVLRPLFLDPLHKEFTKIRSNIRQLHDFHLKLRHIQILDPACGCGNFLVVAYRELRLLELEVLHARYPDAADFVRGLVKSIVDVDHFHGIEIEEWPAQIAQVAMWLTDHQMNTRVSQEFGPTMVRLPLTASANIVHGNALTMDWEMVTKPASLTYIVGNPPFVGAREMSADQKADIAHVFGSLRRKGDLDYVTCWYRKIADAMAIDPAIRSALVSTNSITQGNQPTILWNDLWPRGVKIDFAHRTFRWTSEAPQKASVHCVIIGFSLSDRTDRVLFDYATIDSEPLALQVEQINPYLINGPQVVLPDRETPLCDVPQVLLGNQPIDDGKFLFSSNEKRAFLALDPGAGEFFKRWIGAKELIEGLERWVLDLRSVTPQRLRASNALRDRIAAVRHFRAASPRQQTQRLALTPNLLGSNIFPSKEYLVIPRHCSEARGRIPMAFASPDYVCGDANMLIPEGALYHFGVLMSTMHMAWVRVVCGRIKSDYRYSAGIVYNNFPWPSPTRPQRTDIEARADDVLRARATHTGATLADLYDLMTMPANLVAAHRALDRAVDAAYRRPRGGWVREADRVAFLFSLYRGLAAPMDIQAVPKRRRRANTGR